MIKGLFVAMGTLLFSPVWERRGEILIGNMDSINPAAQGG